MRVLVVMPLAEQRGGAELSLVHLFKHSQPGEVEWVVVFLKDGPMVAEVRAADLKVFVVQAGRLRQPSSALRAIVDIARIARRERSALILGWMSKGQVYGGAAARLLGRPTIFYQHGTPGARDWLGRVATGLATHGVIAVSQYCGDAQRAIRPTRRLRVVYPGADLARFDPAHLEAPAATRSRLGLAPDGPLIGMVTRLQRWKGVDVLIDALTLVRQSHPLVHCVVVGGAHDLEAAYENQLKHQVSRLGLVGHVTFAGMQANVPEWMQAMDVVIHAADREPFGMVVVEAMALGKAVIAGADGGPREIVTNDVDGVLTPYGDEAALAASICRYLDDAGFRRRVGGAARVRAAAFSAPQYAQNVLTALRELLD